MLSISLHQVALWKQQIIYGNWKELSRLMKIYLTLFVLRKKRGCCKINYNSLSKILYFDFKKVRKIL
jgi:hypothetical protein